MWIDTHAHIDREDFTHDFKAVLERAKQVGVEKIGCVATTDTVDDLMHTLSVVAAHPDLFAIIGVHPHNTSGPIDDRLRHLEELATSPEYSADIKAIGETGLDTFYDHAPLSSQETWFRAHLDLAKRLELPVVCHIRDAHQEALEILKDYPTVRGIIHCFTGNKDHAQKYVELGYFLSLSGIVTFPGKRTEELREAATWVPQDRILVETDCPFLAPVPYRGKRNEPSYVAETATFLANLRNTTVEDFARQTTGNARKILGL